MKAPLLLVILFALALPVPAPAAPAITCHCFRDRSFDPGRPAAVDPYLLAASQSSLLAAVFGLDKKKLVKTKMAGTPGDVLWVAHYLADRTGRPASDLIAAHGRNGGSWKAAAAGLDHSRLTPRFAELLAANAAGETLAAAAADEIVTTRLGVNPEAVERIRANGGTNAELILAAYLGRKGGRSSVEIFSEVAAGRATWGQVLNEIGGKAGGIEEDIRQLVR